MHMPIRKKLGRGSSTGGTSWRGTGPGSYRRPLFLTGALLAVASISAGVYFAFLRPSGPELYSTNVGNIANNRVADSDQTAQAVGAPAQGGGSPSAVIQPVIPAPRNPTAVAAWKKGKGGAALTAISQHLGQVLMAYGVGEYTVMRQACARLTPAVATANESAPIPDTAMQVLYERTLNLLTTGAAACKAGITSQPDGPEDVVIHTNASLLGKALADFKTGTQGLYSETEAMKTLKANARSSCNHNHKCACPTAQFCK
jgi:hypothetical protein